MSVGRVRARHAGAAQGSLVAETRASGPGADSSDAQVARDPGLGAERLYEALSGECNPSSGTLLKVIAAALGIQLNAAPKRAG